MCSGSKYEYTPNLGAETDCSDRILFSEREGGKHECERSCFL